MSDAEPLKHSELTGDGRRDRGRCAGRLVLVEELIKLVLRRRDRVRMITLPVVPRPRPAI